MFWRNILVTQRRISSLAGREKTFIHFFSRSSNQNLLEVCKHTHANCKHFHSSISVCFLSSVFFFPVMSVTESWPSLLPLAKSGSGDWYRFPDKAFIYWLYRQSVSCSSGYVFIFYCLPLLAPPCSISGHFSHE